MTTILGVSGSLRDGSFNTSLLRAAAEAAPEGVELELWEGLAELPLYDEELDNDDPPESVRRLREAWGEADAILFATPEYNGSVPGGLKNAIDWASRPRARSAAAQQDGRGRRREHRPVRRALGAAGSEADPRHRRRTRRRNGDPGRARPREVRQQRTPARRRALRAAAPPPDDARRGIRRGSRARRRLADQSGERRRAAFAAPQSGIQRVVAEALSGSGSLVERSGADRVVPYAG